MGNWRKRTLWFLVFLAAALVPWPGLAAAQGPNARLYEVTENMKLKSNGVVKRLATAGLAGTVDAGTPLCPLPMPCGITALATDSINLATGAGPVKGTFAVVVQGDNPVDGPEFVILRGKLKGKIDLALAVLGPDGIPESGDELPLGTITGRWEAEGVSGGPLAGVEQEGTFTGTFRLPFDIGFGPWYMLNPFAFPGSGSFVAVADEEHSLGVPTVRLEANFQSGGGNHHDRD